MNAPAFYCDVLGLPGTVGAGSTGITPAGTPSRSSRARTGAAA